MKIPKLPKLKKYTFEFLSIFVAVISAFALNNWNDHRRDKEAEHKILQEISNGLSKDLEDIEVNRQGHINGIYACNYWRRVARGIEVSNDSLEQNYFGLTRDYFSIQNSSGYESLKSKGLEIISDDSLRYEIISLNEYDFKIIRKFEEEYGEMQFHRSFFNDFNSIVVNNLEFSEKGVPIALKQPLDLNETERKRLLSILYRIEVNRSSMIEYYGLLEAHVRFVKAKIDQLHQE